MPTHDEKATDNVHSSPAAAQQKPRSLTGIADQIGGVVNVIHGTGEVIRGRVHADGREIIAAGKDEVERGLNRIEGRQTATATGDQDGNQRGVGDGTSRGAAGHDLNTPQAPTAVLRTDATSEKGKGVAADTRYLEDRGPAGAAKGTYGHGEEIVNTTPPRDPFNAADAPGVSSHADVRQQGNPSDRGRESHANAGGSYSGQKQPSGTA